MISSLSSLACKARGFDLRVHFKNTRETAHAIKGMNLRKAEQFLHDVIAKKQIVPFLRYNGGVGRKAQVCCVSRWAIIRNHAPEHNKIDPQFSCYVTVMTYYIHLCVCMMHTHSGMSLHDAHSQWYEFA